MAVPWLQNPAKKLVCHPLKTDRSLSPEPEVSSRSQEFHTRLCFRRDPACIPSQFPESLGPDVLPPSDATLAPAAHLDLIHICFCPFFPELPSVDFMIWRQGWPCPSGLQGQSSHQYGGWQYREGHQKDLQMSLNKGSLPTPDKLARTLGETTFLTELTCLPARRAGSPEE